MLYYARVPSSITSSTIGVVSAQVTDTLKTNARYLIVATVACWIAQGATLQVAVVGAAGSMFVPAGQPILITGADGAFLSVIGTAGTLTVTGVGG